MWSLAAGATTAGAALTAPCAAATTTAITTTSNTSCSAAWRLLESVRPVRWQELEGGNVLSAGLHLCLTWGVLLAVCTSSGEAHMCWALRLE